MKNSVLALFLIGLMGFSSAGKALNEFEAEDLADLTAIFVYLKNHCGYGTLPDEEIYRTLAVFAQQNRWDLSNYHTFDMDAMGAESYRDLRNIDIPQDKKCRALARNSLGLLAYAR